VTCGQAPELQLEKTQPKRRGHNLEHGDAGLELRPLGLKNCFFAISRIARDEEEESFNQRSSA